ncbi:MAG TPA: hypothetical protein VGO49_23560 [Bradyrhizobium sp.]|jgi:hypothetical protein|nr:hypothetical protein [Bradyrhizobium sp.]
MGPDFSTKPVGAPVATLLVEPANPAAQEAVATDLPAHQSVAAVDAAPRVRNDTQNASDNVSHQVILDRDAAAVVYQVVDNRTSLVVRQYPDQAVLRRRAYFRALDLMKDDARIRLTDRSA